MSSVEAPQLCRGLPRQPKPPRMPHTNGFRVYTGLFGWLQGWPSPKEGEGGGSHSQSLTSTAREKPQSPQPPRNPDRALPGLGVYQSCPVYPSIVPLFLKFRITSVGIITHLKLATTSNHCFLYLMSRQGNYIEPIQLTCKKVSFFLIIPSVLFQDPQITAESMDLATRLLKLHLGTLEKHLEITFKNM